MEKIVLTIIGISLCGMAVLFGFKMIKAKRERLRVRLMESLIKVIGYYTTYSSDFPEHHKEEGIGLIAGLCESVIDNDIGEEFYSDFKKVENMIINFQEKCNEKSTN